MRDLSEATASYPSARDRPAARPTGGLGNTNKNHIYAMIIVTQINIIEVILLMILVIVVILLYM